MLYIFVFKIVYRNNDGNEAVLHVLFLEIWCGISFLQLKIAIRHIQWLLNEREARKLHFFCWKVCDLFINAAFNYWSVTNETVITIYRRITLYTFKISLFCAISTIVFFFVVVHACVCLFVTKTVLFYFKDTLSGVWVFKLVLWFMVHEKTSYLSSTHKHKNWKRLGMCESVSRIIFYECYLFVRLVFYILCS